MEIPLKKYSKHRVAVRLYSFPEYDSLDLFPISPIGPLTCLFQPALSLAAVEAPLQVAKSIFCLSSSTVLLHITFGRPLFLFPSGAQVKAMRGFCWLFIRNTCPMQRHLRLLICSLMVQVLACRLTSSFDTFIGQYIFSNLRRHLCRNVSSFASSLFFILQVLHP